MANLSRNIMKGSENKRMLTATTYCALITATSLLMWRTSTMVVKMSWYLTIKKSLLERISLLKLTYRLMMKSTVKISFGK